MDAGVGVGLDGVLGAVASYDNRFAISVSVAGLKLASVVDVGMDGAVSSGICIICWLLFGDESAALQSGQKLLKYGNFRKDVYVFT